MDRHGARRALAVVVCCLLVGCTAPEDRGDASRPARTSAPSEASSPAAPPSPSPSTSPSRSRSPAASRPALPTTPSIDDPRKLAAELEQAVATLRDPDAHPVDVRRAAELRQLAARSLALGPARRREQVLGRLDVGTAPSVRSEVRAAGLLHAMTDPQPRFPRWRIVAPPPVDELLGYYRRAQRRTGVPWRFLAAIHLVETRMGRIRGTSTAGAQGPMQFLPSTWELYGGGGDIDDPRDAVLAAARLLRANGAPGDMAEALWHYNPADSYVGAVTEYAHNLQRDPDAYRCYWHWRVLYRHTSGTFVLPVGYPRVRPVRVPEP